VSRQDCEISAQRNYVLPNKKRKPNKAMGLHMVFARKISELRERSRLALKDVESALDARGVDVSHSTIDRMEKGQILPRIDVAFELAKLYGVPLDYLADDEMKSPPEPKAGRTDIETWILETLAAIGPKEMKRRVLQPERPVFGDHTKATD
jgi:transcriptional regulator with XRE-family HTH domain